jgi:predicted DCC family thiol-disulfide oxidoreductase YuxK
MPQAVVLFDGVCNLCNGAVQFIIARDPAGLFQFASLQSPAGAALAGRHGIDAAALDSVILIEAGRAYQRSDAALRIAAQLHGWWSWLRWLRLVPRPLRDWIYDGVARHRYRIFGRREECLLMLPGWQERFLS